MSLDRVDRALLEGFVSMPGEHFTDDQSSGGRNIGNRIMRNLVALQRSLWALEADVVSNDAWITFAVNSGESQVFFLRSNGRIEALGLVTEAAIGDDDASPPEELALFVDLREVIETEDDDVDGSWKWMHYVAELDALVCASTSGVLAKIDLEARDGEEVGAVDSGLRSLAWSSNQEMLALVTGAGVLLVMNTEWEVLYETQLDACLPSGLKLSVLQDDSEFWCCELCWRDDSEYIALNIATTPTSSAAADQVGGNNDIVMQKVLVFTAQLELHAIGRLEDGRATPTLGRALHWSQSMALIASSEMRKQRFFVVFFERNGLRHGEFAIPATYRALSYRITRCCWNAASDVLAVSLQPIPGAPMDESGEERQTVVQLWTRNNYHWYLKQELRFQAENQLIDFAWDDESAGRLRLLTRSSPTQKLTFHEYEFVWDVCSSEGNRRGNLLLREGGQSSHTHHHSVATTGVIDGATLLLTPLHRAMVPPPFALLQTTFEAAINSVVFDSQGDTLLVLLATGKLIIVENYLSPADPQASAAGLPPQLTAKDPSQQEMPRMTMVSVLLPQVLDATPRDLASLLWMHYDNESRQLIFAGKSERHDRFVLGCADCDEGTVEIQATIRHTSLYRVRRAREVLRLPLGDDPTPAADGQLPLSLAVQTQSGAVYTMTPHPVASQTTRIPGKFPMFSHLTVLNYRTTSKSDQQDSDTVVVIGLESSSARLFINGESLASACSSFRYCAVSSVLLYTTQGRESQLRMVPLAALSKDPASSAKSGSSKTHEVRSIERGALLIATVGDSAKMIVQMPRGNLECVTPRLLVLALVVQLIKTREYVAALEMCRRHRLDLNVLVDFDPRSFLDHVADFWLKVSLETRAAAETSDRLCLFITNLHPVDVWDTKYGPLLAPFVATPTAIQESEGDVAYTPDDKVNVVCQRMMRAIQELEKTEEFEAALLLPFVTCAVKQSPPRFEQALVKVQALLQRSREGGENSAAFYRKAATRAIKHLIMLTDVERLYSEALGMYDLKLVRVVATHSQRDPKEYVPFIDRVARFKDENWRRYTIDEHLGRHARALVHLSAFIHGLAGNDEAEKSKLQGLALTLIDQGDLYDQALALFPIAAAKTTANASDQAFHQQILMLKGGFLEAEKHFEAAAYVYLSAADQEKARRAFLSANKWQMALTLSARKQQTAQELRNEAYAIAQELLNQQQQNGSVDAVLAVARIYVEYCDDIDEAVALLVAHQQWTEALRIASLYKREDLIESDVESGLLQSYDDVLEELERNEALYIKHRKRLTTIQEQKRLFKLHGIDGSRWTDDKGDVDVDSVRSGASSAADSALSNVSMSSVGSHNNAASIGNFSMQSLSLATSSHFYATQTLGDVDKKPKGKAKHGGTLPRRERRRRMKEGSAEEEAYVTQQLSELAPSPALTRDVAALLQMLVFFGHMQRAQKLQTQLGGFERRAEAENPPPSAAADRVQWRLDALLD